MADPHGLSPVSQQPSLRQSRSSMFASGFGSMLSPRSSRGGVANAMGASLDPDGSRQLVIGSTSREANGSAGFSSNALRSAKYTPINMIPKALFEQFRRVSNFYFAIIAIIAFIPGVSPTLPAANSLPLIVVVGFGFARDVWEDLGRTREDNRQNSAPQLVLTREGEGAPPSSLFGASEAGPDAAGNRGQRRRKAGGGATALAAGRDVAMRQLRWARTLAKHELDPARHRVLKSRDIRVGDIVFVAKGEVFPADLVLLKSSGEGGVAYVSTANLDGESNLKRQVVAGPTADVATLDELASVQGTIKAQKPDLALHRFEGSMSTSWGTGGAVGVASSPAPLDSSNLLLRGSILRNTDYIYGVAVYTGFDTKVALNMRNPPSKLGQIERKLNLVVVVLFANLAVLFTVAAAASGILQGRFGADQFYMGDFANDSGALAFGRGTGTFLILFATYIPVSLFVTLEFVRVFQAGFMQADLKMKSKGHGVSVKATNLNEVLGQIQFILSDKTGTLTENIMRYVACSAGGTLYDTSKKKNVMQKAVGKGVRDVRLLLLAMALCHTVVPEPEGNDDDDLNVRAEPARMKKGLRRLRRGSDSGSGSTGSGEAEIRDGGKQPEYQGQSPDEVALVGSAREYGVTLVERTLDTMVLDHFGRRESYTALAELEFNSDRKRMSMIFRCPDGKIRMFTKGADTVMLPLLKPSPANTVAEEHIDEFAKTGLRTLIFATKELAEAEFQDWFKEFQQARNLLVDREVAVSEISAKIEQDLDYIAVTAVEDKLQERVPETIKFLREAGVGLWVLTGDKRETAENIGYSANLLDAQMNVVHVQASNPDELAAQLTDAKLKYVDGRRTHKAMGKVGDEAEERLVSSGRADGGVVIRKASSYGVSANELSNGEELGLIIDGASLAFAIEDHPDQFMDLTDHCKTVICCRVTPLQKALVVRMVREMRKSLTLAIGDGGNDVSMIQEAHVGVGLFGKEGTQAARAGDYALSEFRHLQRLLSVHGRYSYVRSAGVINLSFYKNIFFTVTQVLFQFFNFVSGTSFQDQWVVSAFNVLVTAASPLLYGIFERDVEEETIARFPAVYSSNRGDRLFSVKSVIEYAFLYGIWHAVAVFFGAFFGLGYLTIPFSDGRDGGFYFTAFATSVIITFISLGKFVLHSHIINWIVIVGLIVSVGLFFAVPPVSIAVFREFPLEGLIAAVFSSPAFYLTAVGVIAAAFFVDVVVIMLRQLLYPDVVNTLQKWEKGRGRFISHSGNLVDA